MPKVFDPEVKARAVRMVREQVPEYGSLTKSCVEVGRRLGIGGETLRRWVRQAEVDDGARAGVSSVEAAEITALRKENRMLREDNEILRKASIFFAGELDPRKRG